MFWRTAVALPVWRMVCDATIFTGPRGGSTSSVWRSEATRGSLNSGGQPRTDWTACGGGRVTHQVLLTEATELLEFLGHQELGAAHSTENFS